MRSLPRVMGVETEAFLGTLPAPGPVDASRDFVALAAQHLPCLPDALGQGIFLTNGAMIRPDCGHPEYATPEAACPVDVVVHELAGRRVLGRLRDLLEAQTGRRHVVSTCSVDYVHAVFGQHISILHRTRNHVLRPALIPLLVSLQLFAAGGLDPFHLGPRTVLSPRLLSFTCASSAGTTSDRGLFNERRESLARTGTRRLHIIAADGVCSWIALLLRYEALWLAVELAEAGLKPGRGVALRDPVGALHASCRDPALECTVELASGRRATLIEIQRHYLDLAEHHAERLAEWAPAACRRWRAMLDRLERGPAGAARTLDWAIKHAMYTAYAEGRGLERGSIPLINRVIANLQSRLAGQDLAGPLTVARLRSRAWHDARKSCREDLARHGLAWEQVEVAIATRNELCEMDILFGELGRGTFARIEGGLDHRVDEIREADIERACTEPPAGTRASVRGEAVRRYAGRGCRCGWTSVLGADGRRIADLRCPFDGTVRLPELPPGPPL